MACLDRKKLLDEKRLTHVFSMFDTDGSKKIKASEIRNIFQG